MRSVSSHVGAYLERLIRSELAPGDRLPPERVLAERLDVSRGSVREALHELEQRHVVARRPGRGTTVLPPDALAVALQTELSAHDVQRANIAELRQLVEPQIAGLAAIRATQLDLVQLEQTLLASDRRLSPAESLELDVLFHTQLAQACRNPLLVSLCQLTAVWSNDVRSRSHRTARGRRTSVGGHRALLTAVTGRDAVGATAAMVAHLADVADLVGETP